MNQRLKDLCNLALPLSTLSCPHLLACERCSLP